MGSDPIDIEQEARQWPSGVARRPGPLRRPPQLSEEIAGQLRNEILLGRLVEGAHLNVDRLAKETDTSTTPVREALQALKKEGFVTLEPRRGFRVARLRRDDVRDIGLLIRIVAGELGARAASALGSKDLERLHSLQGLMRSAHDRGAFDDVEELDFKFHTIINRASESPKLRWILGILSHYFPRHSYSLLPGWPGGAIEHDAILRSLDHKDAESVRQAVIEHLAVAEEMLIDHLMGVVNDQSTHAARDAHIRRVEDPNGAETV